MRREIDKRLNRAQLRIIDKRVLFVERKRWKQQLTIMATSVTKQTNMNFMEEEEERYTCKSDGCDQVFYLKENLKKHTKTHEKEKKQCCLHCDKKIVRAQNLQLHQQTCEQNNRNDMLYRRYYGVHPSDTVDDGFRIVEMAFKKLFVLYRKKLNIDTINLDDVKLVFSRDVKKLLQREVVARKGIKWSLALKVIMYKAVDPNVFTDLPATFNTDMVMGLIGSDYDEDLNVAFNNVMEQIDNYERNGSGWVMDQFVELDVSIVTYTPFMRTTASDNDSDDYDEENDGDEM